MGDYLWEFEINGSIETYLAKGDRNPDTLVDPTGNVTNPKDLADRQGISVQELLEYPYLLDCSSATVRNTTAFSAESLADFARQTGHTFRCPKCNDIYIGDDEWKILAARYGPGLLQEVLFGVGDTFGLETVGQIISDYVDDPEAFARMCGLDTTGQTEDGGTKIRCADSNCRAQVYPI